MSEPEDLRPPSAVLPPVATVSAMPSDAAFRAVRGQTRTTDRPEQLIPSTPSVNEAKPGGGAQEILDDYSTPPPPESSTQRFTLGQLVEMVQHRRNGAEGRPVDDVGEGWDPEEIPEPVVRRPQRAKRAQTGASLAASAVSAFNKRN